MFGSTISLAQPFMALPPNVHRVFQRLSIIDGGDGKKPGGLQKAMVFSIPGAVRSGFCSSHPSMIAKLLRLRTLYIKSPTCSFRIPWFVGPRFTTGSISFLKMEPCHLKQWWYSEIGGTAVIFEGVSMLRGSSMLVLLGRKKTWNSWMVQKVRDPARKGMSKKSRKRKRNHKKKRRKPTISNPKRGHVGPTNSWFKDILYKSNFVRCSILLPCLVGVVFVFLLLSVRSNPHLSNKRCRLEIAKRGKSPFSLSNSFHSWIMTNYKELHTLNCH